MNLSADHQARETIRTALDATIFVEAAAGTGKTTELINRIINILGEGRTTVDRMVAVTFTDKAAGELKLRLRTGLEEARSSSSENPDRRRHLEQAIAHLEEVRAGTIHSFCADLLRERPMEAQVDPQFQPVDDSSAEELYRGVFRLWLERVLENPPEGVRRSLRRRSGDDHPIARLQHAAWTLVSWRDFSAPWTRIAFDRCAEIDRLVDQLHRLRDLAAQASKLDHPVYTGSWRARQLSEHIRASERARPRDYDGLEAEFVFLAQQSDFAKFDRLGTRDYGPGITRGDVITLHEALVADVKQFAAHADADLAVLVQAELRDSLAAYEELKLRTGRLDFLDLLLRARDLLRNNRTVRAHLQQRFTHIFIDEFQDTDPLQAEILMLLASADTAVSDWRQVRPVPGKLFIVGDPKQAIYRFRRADVELYEQIKHLLVTSEAVKVDLSTSFRSLPSIQNFVNRAFLPRMTRDGATLQAAYVPLAPHREEHADQPSIVALSVPRPYGKRKLSREAVLNSQPDAVGAFIDWLLKESQWTVTERGSKDRVPITPRHIAVMFRRMERYGDDVTKAYVDALEARGIAHLLVGGRSFHQREEVETLRTALEAIEWPDDELSVFATLHGSLFAIPDEVLLAYRRQFHKLHPFRVSQDLPRDFEPIGRALALLQSLCRDRNQRPVVETIHRLLSATRAHAGFALRPSGEQVLANVMHVAELAHEYETGGGTSFRGFVDQLLGEAERGRQAEAAIYEEGTDGVRLMSVHKAKGLEFPVVILADVTAKVAHLDPDRHLDPERGLCAMKLAGWAPHELRQHAAEEHARDLAEGVRVAYVAATRARDLIVVPAVGDDPSPGCGPPITSDWWVSPLYPALYPPDERRRKPVRAKQCPMFGIDSVLIRPDNDPADETNVQPGTHCLGTGRELYTVTWWDPRALKLGKMPSFSIRQEHLLREVDGQVVEADLKNYRLWQEEHEKTLARAAPPSVRLRTASERSKMGKLQAEILIVGTAYRERRFGPRFGSLVHAVLANIALDSAADEVWASVKLHGRIFGAAEEELDAAAMAVITALQHPLMERARSAAAAGLCRREVPLTLSESDGTLVEGIADLTFLEAGKWIVVDFKTDQELSSALDHYRQQITIYAAAISQATACPTEAFLFRL